MSATRKFPSAVYKPVKKPVKIGKPHEVRQQAHAAGFEAASHGMPRSINPHKKGSVEFTQWDSGWIHGEAA